MNPLPTSKTPFHPEQRVGVFIDTQNLYHSAKSNYRAHVNYKALIDNAVAGRHLIRAFAYVIKSDVVEESKFFDALVDMGIETRIKDLQVFYSGEKKADWDVGIAIDIVRMSEKLDVVVLVSGDGDFTEVLKYARSRGIRTEVMAFKKTSSLKLTEEADTFHDLGADPAKYLIPISRSGFRPTTRAKTARPTRPSRPAKSAGSSRASAAARPARPARPAGQKNIRRPSRRVIKS